MSEISRGFDALIAAALSGPTTTTVTASGGIQLFGTIEEDGVLLDGAETALLEWPVVSMVPYSVGDRVSLALVGQRPVITGVIGGAVDETVWEVSQGLDNAAEEISDLNTREAERAVEIEAIRSEFDEFVPGVNEELLALEERRQQVADELAAAKQDIVAANSAAMGANDAALAAANAATAAAGIAEGKADLWIDSSAPPVGMRKTTTLWIDTTGGANTPKRWVSGSTWAAVTDKVALDAANAAVAADQKAQQALTSANGKSRNWYGLSTPTVAGGLQVDDQWFNLSKWQMCVTITPGVTWRDMTPGEGVVPALDIGRGTAGEMEIGRLKVGTTQFDNAVGKAMAANQGFFEDLLAARVSIAPSNMVPWSPALGKGIIPHIAVSGARVTAYNHPDVGWLYRVMGGTGSDGTYATAMSFQSGYTADNGASGKFNCKPGDILALKLVVSAGGTFPAGFTRGARLGIFWQDANGASKGSAVAITTTAFGFNATTRTEEVQVQVPAGAYAFHLSVQKNFWSSGTLYVHEVSAKPAIGAVLIENGAVGAEKLAATIALVSELIAGPPTGTHAKLDQTGFHAYRPLVQGGVAEVVSLGVDGTSDYLSIFDGQGNQLSSLDDVGGGSFQELTSAQTADLTDLKVGGEYGEEWVPKRAARVIASLSFGSGDWGATWAGKRFANRTGWKGVGRLDWTNDTGMARVIWLPPVTATVRTSAAATLGAAWGYTLNGSAPVGNDQEMHVYQTLSAAGYATITSQQQFVKVPKGKRLRARWDIYNGGFEWLFQAPVTVAVWDLGPVGDYEEADLDLYGLTMTSGGDTQGAGKTQKTYTKTYSHSWLRSYNSGGSYNSYYGSKATQGDYGAGNMKGLAGFPSMASDLSGATVTKVEAYVYFAHWWNNSGGTARIGTHGASSAPSSIPSTSGILATVRTAKPGGAWVTLPSSVFAGFKAGTTRGLAFLGTGNSDYGYCTAAKLRVTYRK